MIFLFHFPQTILESFGSFIAKRANSRHNPWHHKYLFNLSFRTTFGTGVLYWQVSVCNRMRFFKMMIATFTTISVCRHIHVPYNISGLWWQGARIPRWLLTQPKLKCCWHLLCLDVTVYLAGCLLITFQYLSNLIGPSYQKKYQYVPNINPNSRVVSAIIDQIKYARSA